MRITLTSKDTELVSKMYKLDFSHLLTRHTNSLIFSCEQKLESEFVYYVSFNLFSFKFHLICAVKMHEIDKPCQISNKIIFYTLYNTCFLHHGNNKN